MVQYVEPIHTSLQSNPLVEVEIAGDGHIHVGIVRRVISEVPYVTEGSHTICNKGRPAEVWDAGLEVGAAVNVGLRSSDDVRAIEGDTSARVIGSGRDVEGETGREPNEWSDLPTGEQEGSHATTVPRAGGNDAPIEDMTHVCRARTVVTPERVRVLHDTFGSQRGERSDAEALGPSVVGEHRVVVGKAMFDRSKQSVVIGVRTIIRDDLG